MPVSRIAEFIETAGDALQARWPGVRIDAFGHVGDGNIHYDVLSAPGGDAAAHNARARRRPRTSCTTSSWAWSGSISAEHGLGTMKTAEALGYKSPVEVAAQRAHPRSARSQADHEPAGAVLAGALSRPRPIP